MGKKEKEGQVNAPVVPNARLDAAVEEAKATGTLAAAALGIKGALPATLAALNGTGDRARFVYCGDADRWTLVTSCRLGPGRRSVEE